MTKLFQHQTVMVSGGLGDIGRATALLFARQGANVAIGDILPAAEANGFLNILNAYAIRSRYTQVDVTDAAAVERWVADTEAQLSVPQIIVANAAVVTLAGIQQISNQQWTRELEVNLNGAFFLTRSATARMLAHHVPGKVVFVGSWVGAVPSTRIPAYSVSKAALTMLCKCMALELASHNILVNEIAPGYVAAGLSGRIWEEHPGEFETALNKVPIKKIMSAETVAEQILRISDPGNEHITGTTIVIDGGLSLLS